MSFKQLNPGLLSSMRGTEVFAFAFRLADPAGTDNPTHLWQAGANAVAAVTRVGEGLYRVQLRKNFPKAMIACLPHLALATATSGGFRAVYVLDSYNPVAGRFDVMTKLDAGDGTEAASDGPQGSVVQVVCFMQSANFNALTEPQGA